MQLECGMPPRSGLQALPEQEVDLTIKVRFMIQQSLPEQVVQFSIFFTIVTINLLCSDCPLVARAEDFQSFFSYRSIHIDCAPTSLIHKERFSNHNETYSILDTALIR